MEDNNKFDKKSSKTKKISFGGVSNMRVIITIVIIFFVYLVFYPDSSFRESAKIKSDIQVCLDEIEKLKQEIKRDCVVITGIKTNKMYLIKYSRESLNLSQEDEDLYVVNK